MITTVLVANRGEVARRVFRACRVLGLRSVAVYSEADAAMSWWLDADEAVPLAGESAAVTYLNQAAIFDAARQAGADAVHPGYGFLAENADFAEACARAGLVFVGPSAESMRLLGSKVGAKAAATAAGVPTVAGFDAGGKDTAQLQAAAAALGYPLLIKASAGGGGRGMRIVEGPAELLPALQAAQAEAVSAFGDGHLLVERYFPQARHVEVQILADQHGRVLHLHERECSIQRRHQKIIEESPSPGLDPAVRTAMAASAVALAREGGYTNAGTVEFLVDSTGGYYLLEMNTRLQVEHPVTEEVAGLDIVAWQLRIAAGEPLSIEQGDVTPRGHAIEARVYAEDPAHDFLPSVGQLSHYVAPQGPGIRCDDGVSAGDDIPGHYDAMIAKVIAYGSDRPSAIARLRGALRDMVVLGVVTNLPYLLQILGERAFLDGATHTRFLDEHLADWTAPQLVDDADWIAAAIAETVGASRALGDRAAAAPDPWDLADGWRN